ncbi:hypothetical protein ACTJKC_15225 [Pedobacter sp. 22226]|uniref:hypothetical protein n=1 Tax=Pedobacter sp. 22226 TaxID=3453894 RepID=UPI003F862F49
MKFIEENEEKYWVISNRNDLEEIFADIDGGEQFACKFRFVERQLFISLLKKLGIKNKQFAETYYHYDSVKKLHISESQFGYVWISTVGLVASRKSTSNRAVNSCMNQYVVISLLLENAIKVIEDEKVYDMDSYQFELLNNLSPAIYQNVVFYIEVFCKAYLSLTQTVPPHTHSLSLIYQKTVEVMTSKNHDDSLFQVIVLEPLYRFVDHVRNIPGGFREHFIKYDDNPQDDTAILFDLVGLNELENLLTLSEDFIVDYYYRGDDTHYLKSNLFQRLLKKADTEDKKKRIYSLYPHLATKIK